MKRFSRALVATFGFVFLGLVVSLVPQKSAVGVSNATQNVNVTNPSLNVNASQSGTWNVGISGTPSVNVSNLPSSQNVSFNGNAQPVTLTKQLVTLVCAGFTSNICTDLERVAADGTLTPYTARPPGFVLVVTDFVWKAASVTPGQVAFATLHHQLTSPPHDVSFSAVAATADGAAVSESHFTSGLPFSDVPIVFVSNAPNVAILQGYFVAAP